MKRGYVNRPQGTGDYLCMFFYTPVRAGCSDQAEWIEGGTLMVWGPGDYQFYGNHRAEYLHTWLHCDGRLMNRLLGGSVPLRTPLFLGSASAFERLVAGLDEEISSHLSPDAIIVENLLENWIRDLGRRLSGAMRPSPERLTRVRDFIDSNFSKDLTLGQLARMANWSNAHFTEEFRKHFGASPIDYVIRQRMHRAAYLLMDINQTVTEVGRMVGYEDLYHFSKLFKRHMGVSPRGARKI